MDDAIEACWFCGDANVLMVIDDWEYGEFGVCTDCADDPGLS